MFFFSLWGLVFSKVTVIFFCASRCLDLLGGRGVLVQVDQRYATENYINDKRY